MDRDFIKEKFSHMKACGGIPAKPKTIDSYRSRVVTLLNRGVLEYLDRPEEFIKQMKKSVKSTNGEATTPMSFESQRGYLKAVIQLCGLLEGDAWSELFKGSREEAVQSYRRFCTEIHIQQKLGREPEAGPFEEASQTTGA